MGVRFHFQHHLPSASYRPWTRAQAAARSAEIVRREYQDLGWTPPDVAVFAHIHFFADGGTTHAPRGVFCPAWQITTGTAFHFRVGGATVEPWGGAFFHCGDFTVAVVADLHANSTVGLTPPMVALDDGGTYTPPDPLLSRWANWKDFWSRDIDAAVLLGDLVDVDSHGGTQIITRNRDDIVLMGLDVLVPVREATDTIYVVRGTQAHSGKSGYLEEQIAREIGATPDESQGTASHWILREVFGDTDDCILEPLIFQPTRRPPW